LYSERPRCRSFRAPKW